MDSVTRLAMAQREIGLAAGEPPATKGYTAERLRHAAAAAGALRAQSSRGIITGFYTVLVEGDDMNEPIGDAVRSDTRRAHLAFARAGRARATTRRSTCWRASAA